jgi:hypothetical protein
MRDPMRETRAAVQLKRDAALGQTGPHGVLLVDGCTLTAGPSDGYICIG